MNETNTPPPNNGSARDTSPTLGERRALVRTYQRQAMARPDPLAANLGVIAGDLMNISHALAMGLQIQLGQEEISAEKRRRFESNMELCLKVVRQFDRLAQIERQLGAASSEGSPVQ